MNICKFESCNNELEGAQLKYCGTPCKKKYHVNVIRRKRKKKAVAYLGGHCIRCGFKEHQSALQFHHRNPDDKSFQVSSTNMTKAWSKVQEELNKCDLLCANCHAIIHWDKGE